MIKFCEIPQTVRLFRLDSSSVGVPGLAYAEGPAYSVYSALVATFVPTSMYSLCQDGAYFFAAFIRLSRISPSSSYQYINSSALCDSGIGELSNADRSYSRNNVFSKVFVR